MLWTMQSDVRVVSNYGTVGTASPGTGVPGHASTPNADGAVTEILSSSANNQESWGILVNITATGLSATTANSKCSILIGGATDDILIPDLICGYSYANQGGYSYFFPLHVPGGVRLAAVFNSVRTAITSRVLVQLFGGGVPPFRVGGKVDVLGTEVSGSQGINLNVAASGGAASVTEMVASSSYAYFALSPGFQPHNDTTITPAGNINVGIGVGASTEERIGTWFYYKDTNEDCGFNGTVFPAFRNVPASTRISLLCSNSGANDTGGYDGHVYAVR